MLLTDLPDNDEVAFTTALDALNPTPGGSHLEGTVGTLLTNAINTMTELITAPTFTEPLQAHAFYSIKKITDLDTAYFNAFYFTLGGSSTNIDQAVTESSNLLIQKFETFRDHFGLYGVFERFSTASLDELQSLVSSPEFNLVHISNNIHETHVDFFFIRGYFERKSDAARRNILVLKRSVSEKYCKSSRKYNFFSGECTVFSLWSGTTFLVTPLWSGLTFSVAPLWSGVTFSVAPLWGGTTFSVAPLWGGFSRLT
jgi:hypothetical protein